LIKHLQSRFVVCSGAMLACLLLAATSSHADKLPTSVQTATDASGFKGQIDQFINKQLTTLKAGGEGTKDARESLSLAATTTGASPSFLQVYSSALAADMAAQGVVAAPDVRVRLNAAIVVFRVALASGNPALANLATTLAQDKSEAVAIWGVKAAQPLLPAILTSAGNPKNLATAVINAAKTQVDSELIPEDAYNALTLFTMSESAKGKVSPAAFKGYLQYPLDLLAFRVSLYQNSIPKNPRADGMGTGYLAGNYGWRLMTVEQQTQTASLIMTVSNGAANQLDVYQTRGDLIALIKAADGNAFEAIGRSIGDTAIEKAANALRTTIGDNSSKDDVLAKIKPVEDAVKARFSATSVAGQ
jgi:hypothetical protein